MSNESRGRGPLLTVIIASICSDARGELLERACNSVRRMAAHGDDYSIIVVANGPKVSPRILSWLDAQPDVRVIQLRSGSHPLARRVGAEMADSEFLAFLDDDDEYLPDTLAMKVEYFRQHPGVDVLVTDGLRVNDNEISRIFPPPEARATDLVETMMRAAWSACSLTLRRDKVDLSVFDAELRHMEWTLTALLLARQGRVGYLDEPTFRYYETTPDSLSKTVAHGLAGPEVWRCLSDSYAGTRYESIARRRYAGMCHNAAHQYAQLGELGRAWDMHARSLLAPGGFAYLAYSAKLAFSSLRRLMAGMVGTAVNRHEP